MIFKSFKCGIFLGFVGSVDRPPALMSKHPPCVGHLYSNYKEQGGVGQCLRISVVMEQGGVRQCLRIYVVMDQVGVRGRLAL